MAAEMLLLLACPVAGGAVLALAGHRRYAAELNAMFAIVTFGAAARLVARVISEGPVSALGEELFVDSLNVFLVALTAFVAMTTALFSRPYMRIERAHGRVTDAGMRVAVAVLRSEANYRASAASRQGIFLYQFEALCRNRLGYDRGLEAVYRLTVPRHLPPAAVQAV